MNYDAAKRLVAQKSGINLAQNRTLIETAILAALEEIGVHLTIRKAVKSKNKTISAGGNYVTWAEEYSRFVSVTYRYAAGTSMYNRPLTKQSLTEYEIDNAGLQSQESDMVTRYCPRGDKIWIGPGNVQTGGTLIIFYQRKLTPEDIEDLPDSNMVVWGGLANVLPIEQEEQRVYRQMFTRALVPASIAATPVIERHDRIKMNPQLLRDQRFLEDM